VGPDAARRAAFRPGRRERGRRDRARLARPGLLSTFLPRLYERLPAPLQNAAVTLYGIKLYLREYGPRFRKALEESERRQWLAPSEIEAYQDERLAELIRHAWENVPYYRDAMRERGLDPRDVAGVADLPKLPLLTAEDVRRNHDRLVSRAHRRSGLIYGHTSGTTGSPLQFLFDARVCLHKNLVDWRHKRNAGLEYGDRLALFLGRVVVPTERKKPPYWRYNAVLGQMFFSSFHMSPDTLPHYFAQLEAFRPRGVEGYPSTLYVLASYLTSRGRTFPVKAAFTSSETLLPHQRETIERAFECPLFDFYGLAERVAFATECPAHDGYHVNGDFGIAEIVGEGGGPAEPGALGRLVGTSLHNYGMPFLRYQTSDVTAIRPTPCPCGRGFPLMHSVATKDEDVITTLDGRYVVSSVLTHPFKPLRSVEESQIVQEDRGHVTVKIVRRPSFSEDDARYILEELHKRLGAEMEIELEFVESIPRTKAGKLRWVISKVPLEF
jgi:phenylacetate-CoA ligase